MAQFTKSNINIPLDVPKAKRVTYQKNYMLATQNSGNLMLFAGDQRVEHLNDDFYGPDISPDDATPEHLFQIAKKAKIGMFATQLGLIAQYGESYKTVPYCVKMNSKSNLVKVDQFEPYSYAWYDVDQVAAFAKQSGLKIPAVGYTIYLGSEFESKMLKEAAQIVHKAHKHGMLALLWIYPRGKAVLDEKDPHLIAGAVDVGAALGADFIKVNFPRTFGEDPAESFKEAILASGRSKVICAGGSSTDVEEFLKLLYAQIHTSGASGNATGRNIHQKPLNEAVKFCNAISAIVAENKTVAQALNVYNGK